MNSPESFPYHPMPVKPDVGRDGGIGRLAQGMAPTIAVYIRMLRARKWMIVATTLAAVIAASIIVQMMTPIFRASVVLLIETGKTRITSIEEIYASPGVSTREAIQTQAEFIKSREVSKRVVAAMDLTENPEFDPRQVERGPVLRWLGQFSLGRKILGPDPRNLAMPFQVVLDSAIRLLESRMAVVPLKQSQLLEIQYEAADPQLAASIANTIADSYIRADLDARFNMQETASKWLSGRVDQLRSALETSERLIQGYREAAGIVVTPGTSMGGDLRQLDTAADRLVQARIARAQAEQIWRQVHPSARNRYQVPAVFNNAAVSVARQAEIGSRQRLNELAQQVGTAHPLYRQAAAELQAAEANFRTQAEAVIASLAKDYEVARSIERATENEVAQSRSTIQDFNRRESELNGLERDVSTNRRLYETFLSRVKETEATSDFKSPVARIVDPADPPIRPFKPRKMLIVLLTLIAALMASGALAIGLELQSAVVRSSDDVVDKLGIGLLAAVPKATRSQAEALSTIQHTDSRSLIAEAIRTALTSIKLSTHETRCPVVGFTSSVPGEGKTTLAINMALEQARTKNVLLIDADLRRPSIAGYLKIDDHAPGLTDLIGGVPIANCVRRMAETNLAVLTTGALPDNPLDQLMTVQFREAIDLLRLRFEMIFIDTPPVELVSDALPVGRQCSGLVFVVKADETPVPIIQRGIARVEAAQIPILGVMLNAHDFDRAAKFYGEYSAYARYAEGYGYGPKRG